MRGPVPLALLALGLGCGVGPPSGACTLATAAGPLTLLSAEPAQSCASLAPTVQARISDYLSWNSVSLGGWALEVVPAGTIGGNHGGMTYFSEKLVRVEGQGDQLLVFVHEMEHVRLGVASASHCGWGPFAAWELQKTGLDETGYDAASCAEESGEK